VTALSYECLNYGPERVEKNRQEALKKNGKWRESPPYTAMVIPLGRDGGLDRLWRLPTRRSLFGLPLHDDEIKARVPYGKKKTTGMAPTFGYTKAVDMQTQSQPAKNAKTRRKLWAQLRRNPFAFLRSSSLRLDVTSLKCWA